MARLYTTDEIDEMVEHYFGDMTDAMSDLSDYHTGRMPYEGLNFHPPKEEPEEMEKNWLDEIKAEFLAGKNVEIEYCGLPVPGPIRELVKDYLDGKVQVVWHSICQKGVTTVGLRVVIEGVEYKTVGSAKWRKPDEFSVKKGFNMAYDEALIELVDRVLNTERRIPSRIIVDK